VDNPVRLVNSFLMTGTPWAFSEYTHYGDFLEALAERTGVHPKNFYLRGSCQIGFSIAPRERVWTAMGDDSDLDLVIVDATYFHRLDHDVRRWEDKNPVQFLQGKASEAFFNRQRDRQFNCCRDEGLPAVVCVHHRDTMEKVGALAHCGRVRRLSAFIYPDWHSARRRYEYDLRELRRGIEAGRLTPPGDTPLPAESRRPVAPSPAAPEAAAEDMPGGEPGRPG
ncbi:MAG TPA: hypothetical protein VG013_37085, partial [Gemmataceae bacterium]|nr:hypothetical protein [Gemmataceae bacterium]